MEHPNEEDVRVVGKALELTEKIESGGRVTSRQDRKQSAKAWKHERARGVHDTAEQTGEQGWIHSECGQVW